MADEKKTAGVEREEPGAIPGTGLDFPFDRLFDLSMEMLCIADLDGRFVRVNRAWSETLGLTREQLEGSSFLEFVHPDDVHQTREVMSALGRQQPVDRFVNRYKVRDGSWRQIEWRATPDGHLVYAAARDVTEQRLYEKSLRESEERYRILFENAVEAVSVIQDGKFVLCNPMAFQLTGYTEADMGKVGLLELIHPDDRMLAGGNLAARYRDNGFRERTELRLVRKDGSILWTEAAGVRIEWNGRPAILSFSTDITRRKEAESALRSSEEKYRMIAEQASDVIWIRNLTRDRFTYFSPSVEQQRGFTPEEAVIQTLEEAYAPDSLESLRNAFNRETAYFVSHPEDVRVYVSQMRQTVKGGGYVWIETATRYRRNEAGETEAIGVSRNIEERKRAEERILQLSFHDQLTGLYNRRFYEEERLRLDTSRNLPMTLVIADVNGLKLVNDAFGHQAGDRMLVRIASLIRNVSRADDIVARIGGDEFVLLLPKTGTEEATGIVRRIREAIAGEEAQPAVISVSFGMATKEKADEDMSAVFTEAENAMYREKLTESNSMRSETIRIVARTLYLKSPKEQMHGNRVAMLCGSIARAMGMREEEIRELTTAGLMHDIGKIVLDEALLEQAAGPTEDQWTEIRRHPEIGYQILRGTSEFAPVANAVLSHHERIDGKGYPRGSEGDKIPVVSRILAIAEAYDEMTSDRVYRKRMDEEKAVREIRLGAGTQFDEKIARVFITKVLGRHWEDVV